MAGKQSGPLDLTKRSQYLRVDKQLMEYFKRIASGIMFPMLLGFLAITFCRRTRNATVAFGFFALISLFLNTAPLLLAGRMKEKKWRQEPCPEGGSVDEELVEECDRRRIRLLCSAVFISIFVLMITAACLTTLLNVTYFCLAVAAMVLIGVPYGYYHIEHSMRNTVDWGAVQYEEFQDDIKYFFDLSSEATKTAFLGLPAMLSSQLKNSRCQRSAPVRVPEALTMYTVLFGLFVMLMCSVPVAEDFKETREKFVKVLIRYSTYALLALIAIVAFLAANEIFKAYVVLAFVILFGTYLGGLYWNISRVLPSSEPKGNCEDKVSLRSRSLVWFGFCPAMFGVLMASYSRSISGGSSEFTSLYKTCAFFIFIALIANITRMLLVQKVREEDGGAPLLLISGIVNVAFMELTVFSVVLLALLQPQQIQDTFVLT